MAKKELRLHAVVAPTQTVVASAGSHTQITGEVKNILADESILNEKGRILLEKLRPIIYDEEQGRYLAVGEKLADAFRTGMELRKRLEDNKNG